MADYSEYKPRTFEDSLKDLTTLEEVIKAYRTLAYSGEIESTNAPRTRSDYALKRLRADLENLIKLRDNRYAGS